LKQRMPLFGGILNVVNIEQWAYWHHHGMQSLSASPYWSLSLEEQFYLLCAPLLLFVPRKWVIALLVFAIAVQFPIVRNANSDDLAWFIRSDAFAWGVLLSLFASNRVLMSLVEPTLLRSGWFALPFVVFLLASVAVMPQLMYALPFGVGLMAALSGLLVFIASYDKGYLGLHGCMARLLSWVGDRSYAIYLVNGPVIALGLRLPPFSGMDRANTTDLLLLTGAFLSCTLVLAELTYRLIEVPARLHGRKLARAYGGAASARGRYEPAAAGKTAREAESG
jgi:peptidoglycan/LPS O-acetylase OafA/YrhL